MMSAILFTNVNIFDGINENLIKNANVLVEDNTIKTVSTEKIETGDATVINGGDRTLTPGLIDAHWHTMLNFWPISKMVSSDFGHHSIASSQTSRNTLLRGFTSVRDAGGNCIGVKRAIDEGLVDAPEFTLRWEHSLRHLAISTSVAPMMCLRIPARPSITCSESGTC